MNLRELIEKLNSFGETLTLQNLKDLLAKLEVLPSEIETYQCFDEVGYQRNLIQRTDHYEALLLCFKAGQRTPIHDHSGSACGVKVIIGVGMETAFSASPNGWLFATGSYELQQGGVVGSEDMDIHQLSNLQCGGERLVTLHIYSPPLGEVGNYSLENNAITYVTAASRYETRNCL